MASQESLAAASLFPHLIDSLMCRKNIQRTEEMYFLSVFGWNPSGVPSLH